MAAEVLPELVVRPEDVPEPAQETPGGAVGAAKGQIAVNAKGEVMILGADGWAPAPIAEDGKGGRMFYDGSAWTPVPAVPESKPGRGVVEQAGRVAGRTARAALEGAGAALSLPSDVGALAGNLPFHAWNRVAGGVQALGGPDLSVEAPFEYGVPSRAAHGLADRLGLPEGETPGERVADRIGSELVGTGLGAGLGGAAVRGLEAGARLIGGLRSPGASRGASQGSAETVARALSEQPVAQATGAAGSGLLGGAAHETGAPPLVEAGASLLGGALGGAAAGAGQVKDTARGVARGVAAPFSPEGRDQVAGSFFRQRAVDPDAALERLEAQNQPLVPGSQPTSAETARDPGLLATERGLRNSGRGELQGEFSNRDVARTEARREVIEGLGPETGEGAGTAADAVGFRVGQVRQGAENAEAVARGPLAAAEGALPPAASAEAAGDVLRPAIDTAHQARKDQTSGHYRAIDPEGTSQIPVAPVRAAVDEAVAALSGPLAPGAPRELLLMQERMAGLEGEHATVSWRDLQDLRQWAGDHAHEAMLRQRHREAGLYGSVVQAIDNAGARAAEPYLAEGRPLTQADLDASEAAEGAAAHPDIERQLSLSERELAARIDAEKSPHGLSLVQMLRQRGGIKNDAGDVMAILGSTRAMPALISGKGMGLDRAAQAAWELGYLGPKGTTYTPRELLDAVDLELRGLEKRYPQGIVVKRDNKRAPTVEDDLDQEVSARGGNYVPRDPQATLRSLAPGPQENAPELPPPGDEGMIMPGPEAFTRPQAEQWAAARDSRIRQGEDFESGAMGRATRPNSPTPDSGLARSLFHGDVGGREDAAQALRALGDNREAMAALEQYAAGSLRDFALRPDGTLNPARIQAWLGRHRGALQSFPELGVRFRTVADAAAEVERVVGVGRASVEEMEKGVARYFLQGQDPVQAVRAVIGSGESQKSGMAALVGLVGRDAAALRGLRRAYVDLLLERSTTSAATPNGAGEMVEGMAGAALRRTLLNTRAAASALFSPAELRSLDDVVRDFQAGMAYRTAGAPVGSPTAQNLSMAYVLGQALGTPLEGQSAAATLANNTVGRFLSRWVFNVQAPEIERLLVQAALDPAIMARVMRAAKAGDAEAFTRWAARHGSESVREAIGKAGIRTGVRGAIAIENQQGERDPVDAAAQRQRVPEREGFAGGGRLGDAERAAIEGWLEQDLQGRMRDPSMEAAGARVFRSEPREQGLPYSSALRVPYAEDVRLGSEGVNQGSPRQDDYPTNPNLARQGERARFGRAQAPWEGGRAIAGLVVPETGEDLLADGAMGLAAKLPLPLPLRAAVGGLGLLAASGSEAEGAPIKRFGDWIVHHGSPHVFDSFSTKHIGKGEGAQVFGQGLYFTENPKIAEKYREDLTYRHGQKYDEHGEAPWRLIYGDEGEKILSQLHTSARYQLRHPFTDFATPQDLLDADGTLPDLGRHNYHSQEWMQNLDGQHEVPHEMMRDHMQSELAMARNLAGGGPHADPSFLKDTDLFRPKDDGYYSWDEAERQIALLDELAKLRPRWEPALGAQYDVRLNADPGRFLNLDGGMNRWDQPEAVRRALELKNWGPRAEQALFSEWDQLADPRQRIQGVEKAHLADQAADDPLQVDGPPRQFRETARDLGIVGNRYLDGNSRKRGSGSHNLVLFDDSPAEIVRRYAEGGPVAGLGGPDEFGEGGLVRKGIQAFHGSPHSFDRFDYSKIGSGEGAQAYGHGLYFAGSEGVARDYHRRLAPMHDAYNTLGGEKVTDRMVRGLLKHPDPQVARFFQEEIAPKFAKWKNFGEQLDGLDSTLEAQAAGFRERRANLEEGLASGRVAASSWSLDDYDNRIAAVQSRLDRTRAVRALYDRVPERRGGNMYEVRLDLDPEQLLDLDRPAAQQSSRVREVLGDLGALEPDYIKPETPLPIRQQIMAHMEGTNPWTGDSAYRALAKRLDDTGQYSRGNPAAASAALREAGVPALQYLDGMSRRAGEGSHNYVTFSDEPVEIIRRYAAGGLMGGAPDMIGQSAPGMSQATAAGFAEARAMYGAALAGLG
jgi:hypothetical protein